MDSPKFSIGESFSFGWEGMKKYFWFFFVSLVGSTVLGIMLRGFQGATDKTSMDAKGWLFFVASVVFGLIVQVGMMKSELAVADEKAPTYAFFKPQVLLMVKLGLLYLLMILLLGVSSLFLIFPGIYFYVRLQYAYLAVVDHGFWPFKAMGHSWKITRGHWWDLLLFNIASFGVSILGFIALLIGLFVSTPVTRIANAHVYRKLSR